MGNKTTTINLNDNSLLRKSYKLRGTGREGRSIETCIPKEVFEREARRLGLTLEEALEKLLAVWQYNGFAGLFLSFELKQETKKPAPAKALANSVALANKELKVALANKELKETIKEPSTNDKCQ